MNEGFDSSLFVSDWFWIRSWDYVTVLKLTVRFTFIIDIIILNTWVVTPRSFWIEREIKCQCKTLYKMYSNSIRIGNTWYNISCNEKNSTKPGKNNSIQVFFTWLEQSQSGCTWDVHIIILQISLHLLETRLV